MTPFIIVPLVIAFCLMMQAFFAASEMALISFDYIRLKNRAEKGDARASAMVYFLERPDLLFGTTLLGVNLAIILHSASASYLCEIVLKRYQLDLPVEVTPLLSSAFVVPLILFFGDFLPMGFSRLNPHWFEAFGINLFRPMYIMLYPLVKIT
jgi:putative hemolysin